MGKLTKWFFIANIMNLLSTNKWTEIGNRLSTQNVLALSFSIEEIEAKSFDTIRSICVHRGMEEKVEKWLLYILF